MDPKDIHYLRNLISHQDLIIEQATQIRAHLRGVLVASGVKLDGSAASESTNGNGSAKPSHKAKADTFNRKYELSSRDYVANVLRDAVNPLPLRELQDRLIKAGKEFADQTIHLALQNLMKDGMVAKVAAPAGSGASVAFQLAGRPSE